MVYNAHEYDIFIGIDVDKSSFSFTVKNQDTMNRSHKIPANPENLYRHIKSTYDHRQFTLPSNFQ